MIHSVLSSVVRPETRLSRGQENVGRYGRCASVREFQAVPMTEET